MLKNIILKVIADKKKRNIEPTHATLKEVYAKAIVSKMEIVDVKNGLNELYLAGDIEVGNTLNDKYITIK